MIKDKLYHSLQTKLNKYWYEPADIDTLSNDEKQLLIDLLGIASTTNTSLARALNKTNPFIVQLKNISNRVDYRDKSFSQVTTDLGVNKPPRISDNLPNNVIYLATDNTDDILYNADIEIAPLSFTENKDNAILDSIGTNKTVLAARLDTDTRYIDYKVLYRRFDNLSTAEQTKYSFDEFIYAVCLGYDAVSYKDRHFVLNRTKLTFKTDPIDVSSFKINRDTTPDYIENTKDVLLSYWSDTIEGLTDYMQYWRNKDSKYTGKVYRVNDELGGGYIACYLDLPSNIPLVRCTKEERLIYNNEYTKASTEKEKRNRRNQALIDLFDTIKALPITDDGITLPLWLGGGTYANNKILSKFSRLQ